MYNIIDKDKNITQKLCVNCNSIKYIKNFYEKDSNCIKCRSLLNKEKRIQLKETMKILYEKMDKLQNINNMLIEKNIKKDKLNRKLQDELNNIKDRYKRNGIQL